MFKEYKFGYLMRKYGEQYIFESQPCLTGIKAIRSIRVCRTPVLGGKQIACESCVTTHTVYNSCGNRNCPICQSIKKEIWIDKQLEKMLPVSHYHVIFTLPHELNPILYSNQRLCYDLLIRTAWESIKSLCSQRRWLGAETGMISMLHTWGSNLSYHPHIHAIVPSGGLRENEWINSKEKKFFLPYKILSKVFKDKFLQKLSIAWEDEQLDFYGTSKEYEELESLRKLMNEVGSKNWNVRIEKPVKGAQQIYEYLSRYVHRPAMADSRILKIEEGRVHFSYKNYAAQKDGAAAPIEKTSYKIMDFIKNYLDHVLPSGFQKVRYYGIFSSACAKGKLAKAKSLLRVRPTQTMRAIKQILKDLLGKDIDVCDHCGASNFVTTMLPTNFRWLLRNITWASGRSPPKWYHNAE